MFHVIISNDFIITTIFKSIDDLWFSGSESMYN